MNPLVVKKSLFGPYSECCIQYEWCSLPCSSLAFGPSNRSSLTFLLLTPYLCIVLVLWRLLLCANRFPDTEGAALLAVACCRIWSTYWAALLGPSPLSDSSLSLWMSGWILGVTFFLGLARWEMLVSPLSPSGSWGFAADFFAFCWAGAGSPMLAFLFFCLLNVLSDLVLYLACFWFSTLFRWMVCLGRFWPSGYMRWNNPPRLFPK